MGRLFIGCDCRLALALLAIAMAAFLMGPAEVRLQFDQPVEQAMRRCEIDPRPRNYGGEIEDLGIIATRRHQPGKQHPSLRHIAARERHLGFNQGIGLHVR